MAENFQMRVNAEGIVSLLRTNLIDRYKDCFCIIQELLQNADDAKASRVHFGVSEGLAVNHPLGRLPALYIINDGPVSVSNMTSIYTVASGDKGDASDKIGKFGLGMKSVFHVCEGFFMLGDRLGTELSFPYFCTPWTEDYHPDWHEGWDEAKKLLDAAVRERIKDAVTDWDRWFCVWLPLRDEALHTGNQTKPIIQMYPTDQDLDEFTGHENATRAAHMLPLLRHVKHLSFTNRQGESLKFDLDGSGRMSGGSGRFSGSVHATGKDLADFHYSGVETKVEGGEFAHLKGLRCWPKNTRFVRGEGLKSFPDKTDSHVALCFLTEESSVPSLTVSPCVFLPLSEVRENPSKYTRSRMGGKYSVTIDLHGSLFVDAGRQVFSLGSALGRDPQTETELRAEWNRRIYEEGILPQVVPELYSVLRTWDEETAGAVMLTLREIPFFSQWMSVVCRSEGIVRELTAEGYSWERISSSDCVYAMEPPRSPVVRKVIAAALPDHTHVIDSTAGRLLKPGSLKPDFSSEISERMLRAIADLDPKESDNEVLRQFAQGCASRLDFSKLDEELRNAPIWKASDGRYSYNELADMARRHRLYCHAEGEVRKVFLAAVECSPVQINEPLVDALRLDVPDFTYEFVVDVLQDGPRLRDVESRKQLLQRLLHKSHGADEQAWIKACRYLVHGEARLFDCSDPLFMPVEGDFQEFSEKIVDVLARHRYGTSCHVPKAITDVLNKSDLVTLNLPLSTPESLVRALSEVGDLSSEGFSKDDWQKLVMMVQNLSEQPEVVRALRRIPLFPTDDGRMTALDGNTYYEKNDYLVAPQLRPYVKILAIDGEERLVRRMCGRDGLAQKWNTNACISAALHYRLDLKDFVPVVIDALDKAETIELSLQDPLRRKDWVQMTDGRILSPLSIMNLPCVSGLVPGCDTLSDVADAAAAKIIRRHGLFQGLQASVERLFEAMANIPNGQFALGEFKNSSGAPQAVDIAAMLAVLPENIAEILPALGVLKCLRDNHISFLDYLPRIKTRLPLESLVRVLSVLTDRTGDENVDRAQCWTYLLSYLDEAARREDFMSAIMPRLRFRNQNGALKKPGELCVGVTGAPSKYILNDSYTTAQSFISAIETAVRAQMQNESRRQISIVEYFADWLPTLSEFEDRIGGFIICCTDQEDELQVAKQRYGFGNKSIAAARESISAELDSFLSQQHCYVLATPDELVRVIAIDGTEMSVSLSPLATAKDLFFGQFNQCEVVKNSCLWSMAPSPMPVDKRSLIIMLRKLDRTTLATFSPEKLDALLENTLAQIIEAYGCLGANVEAYWQSLKNVEQLDVRVTKSVILQSLDMYLPQIRCKNESLKETFKESRRLQYGEEQARFNALASHRRKTA